MIKIFLNNNCSEGVNEIKYILSMWAHNCYATIDYVQSPDGAIIVDDHTDSTLQTILTANCNFNNVNLSSDGFVELRKGQIDYLSSVFYLLNSIQEHNDSKPDELGRFRYRDSFQFKLSLAQKNLVQECFDEISKKIGVSPRSEKSAFFLTHDIDMVYGSILEDGFNVIKKGRFDLFLSMLVRLALGKPDWLNIDKIMALESEYDCKSIFYWIVNKGIINKRERNADYDFQSKKIQQQFTLVEQSGFENGIHKSISNESFEKEITKYGQQPIGNRYHYLKFNLPSGYDQIEKAGLKLDASLGFAEEIGFRNNYGLPFQPYNLKERRPYSFVEVPLHIMDRTFFQYKKSSLLQAEQEIFEFFEKNKTNCVLSVLWHNNFFTNYKFKGYLDLYKKILVYIKENNFNTISQKEIIDTYTLK